MVWYGACGCPSLIWETAETVEVRSVEAGAWIWPSLIWLTCRMVVVVGAWICPSLICDTIWTDIGAQVVAAWGWPSLIWDTGWTETRAEVVATWGCPSLICETGWTDIDARVVATCGCPLLAPISAWDLYTILAACLLWYLWYRCRRMCSWWYHSCRGNNRSGSCYWSNRFPECVSFRGKKNPNWSFAAYIVVEVMLLLEVMLTTAIPNEPL